MACDFNRLLERSRETREDEEEAIDKKNKGLALKTSIPSSGKSEDDNAEGLDAKNLNLLVRRLKKFLKKKRDFRNGTF